MSRNGGLDWERTRRATREQSARANAPGPPIYVRRAERSDHRILRCMRFEATCDECGHELLKGERAWMHRDSRWHFAHEACRDP